MKGSGIRYVCEREMEVMPEMDHMAGVNRGSSMGREMEAKGTEKMSWRERWRGKICDCGTALRYSKMGREL